MPALVRGAGPPLGRWTVAIRPDVADDERIGQRPGAAEVVDDISVAGHDGAIRRDKFRTSLVQSSRKATRPQDWPVGAAVHQDEDHAITVAGNSDGLHQCRWAAVEHAGSRRLRRGCFNRKNGRSGR